MRPIRHVTPRYIYNRVQWKLFEMKNPDKPWVNQEANRLLQTLLVKTDRAIEWGSGRSTKWFSQKVGHLTSVESDTDWYNRVSADLKSSNINNVEYLLRPDLSGESASEYVRAVDRIPDQSLGFALVDGQLREHCALAVIPKIAPGGILMWDNANWFIDWPTKSPASRYGRGPLNDLCKQFLDRVRNWRFIWTSRGISDSAFWIRPADTNAAPSQA